MGLVIDVARKLRDEHHFRGYIHLKTIPEASPALIEMAGRYADRISINIELPTEQSVATLAPEKNLARTQEAMNHIRNKIDERFAEKSKEGAPKPPPFATGQSTQMIVGADDSTDSVILRRADTLYTGFKVDEITTAAAPNLDLALDPKLSWALRNRECFPIDINRASREQLLRIPGLGVRNTERILDARRFTRLRLADIVLLRLSMKKILPFIIAAHHTPTLLGLDDDSLRQRFLPPPKQMELDFDNPKPVPEDFQSVRSGEI